MKHLHQCDVSAISGKCFSDISSSRFDPSANSTGVFLEVVKRKLRILANLDQIAVWIA
jgi:hypothetical protein